MAGLCFIKAFRHIQAGFVPLKFSSLAMFLGGLFDLVFGFGVCAMNIEGPLKVVCRNWIGIDNVTHRHCSVVLFLGWFWCFLALLYRLFTLF